MDNYRSVNSTSLPISANTQFSFDGQTLNLNQTPTFYDMEDEDLMDVIVKISASATTPYQSQTQTATASSSSSNNKSSHPSIEGWRTRHGEIDRVIIITRIKNGDPNATHKYQLRKMDPFQKLVDVYRKQTNSSSSMISLEYNGRRLELSSTPSKEGMVDNTTLDICDHMALLRGGGVASVVTLPSSSNNKIAVKIRINGKDSSVQTYKMELTERFQKIMDEFCGKNGVTLSDCKFTFDGDVLRPMNTPQQEDLEGDEIVDVMVDPNLLAAPKTTTKSTSASNPMPASSTSQTHTSSTSDRPLSLSSTSSASASVLSVSSSSTYRATPARGVPKKAIKIQTIRNNKKAARPKQFRLYNTDTIGKLRKGYIDYYKSKGCQNVQFYFTNALIKDDMATLESLGVREMSTLYAIENGKKYVPV
mmetsp:Transcript_8389/g.11999  ORF Transcript_8389/g.11999 Transcript_8389/m.11999 type:complete len:420 (-) Transcript_8389:232-1491(-)